MLVLILTATVLLAGIITYVVSKYGEKSSSKQSLKQSSYVAIGIVLLIAGFFLYIITSGKVN